MNRLTRRQDDILALARELGRVEVDDLAARHRVSTQTIRKDLNELGERRLLQRVHGGAIMPAGLANTGYEARRHLAREQKRLIGVHAARLIPDNCSLFINIGTTTEQVASALHTHRDLMVITNSINVATLLRPVRAIQVVIAGGVVRHSDGGIVGEAAVEFIGQFKVDFAVIGASAIDGDGALLDFDYREVSVARAIMHNARHVILVCDSSKLRRSAPVRIGHLAQIDTLVTDRLPAGALRTRLAREDVRLVEAEVEEEQTK